MGRWFIFVLREMLLRCFNNNKLNLIKNLDIIGYYSVNYRYNKVHLSEEILQILGKNNDCKEISIEDLYDYFIDKDYIDIVKDEFSRIKNKNKFEPLIINITTPAGSKWVKIIGRFIFNKKGELLKITGIVQDITDLKEKEIRLEEEIKERKKNELNLSKLLDLRNSVLEISYAVTETSDINALFNIILERALKSIRDGQIGAVLVLDKQNKLKIVAVRGYKATLIENFDIKLDETFIYRNTKGNIRKTVIINDIEDMLDIAEDNILDNDGELYIKSSLSAPIFVNNKLYGFLNVDSENKEVFDERDIELMEYLRLQVSMAIEKHLLYEKTIRFSRYDELTGVFNRRYFEERLDMQLEKSKRDNERFYFIIFDLDKFKEINDTYGHLVGDIVLRDFANRLMEKFRSNDIIGRFGGDEFVALIYNIDRHNTARKVETIRKELKQKIVIDENTALSYDFSYGISSFMENTTDFNSLLKDADKKMYKNKNKNIS